MTEGEIIKEFREFNQLTVIDLALKNGVPVRSINNWESGRVKLPFHKMKKILESMNVEVELRLVGDYYEQCKRITI